MPQTEPAEADRPRWGFEKELLLLILVVGLVYFPRLTSLPTRGEETRWASVAVEMQSTGDYVVPRQQGEPFLSRPPLGSWLMAAAAGVRGRLDLASVRLPTAIAVLLTSVLCYAYTRQFASRIGALASGLSFATCVQVLQLGRVGETDCVFALLVSGSLLLWHLGMTRGWNSTFVWTTCCAMAACATLAKGLQAPVYFAGSTALFSIVSGRWRTLMRPPALLGAATYVAVVASWHVPFFLQLGAAGTHDLWSGDVKLRFEDSSLGTSASHLLTFPFELFACFLPWSALLALWLSPGLRKPVEKSPTGFLLTCLVVAFPTVWFTPGAKVRYFLPLFPVMCTFTGLAVDRWLRAGRAAQIETWNRRASPALAVFLMVVAGSVAVLTWGVGGLWRANAGASSAAAAAIASMLLPAGFLLRKGKSQANHAMLQLTAVGVVVAAFHTGPSISFVAARSMTTMEDVAEVRSLLPSGADLVSLGPVHHRFAYCFGKPIALLDWPDDEPAPEVAPGGYFCFCRWAKKRRSPQFAWEEIAVVNCDRNTKLEPNEQVVVARRLVGVETIAGVERPSAGPH